MSGPWEEFSKPAADDGPWNEFSNGDAKKQNKGIVGDLVTDLKRGVQNLPGTLSGIGDMVVAPVVGDAIVSKGWDLAGKKTGFQPSKWAKEATAEYSDQRKAGNESVEKAWEDNSTPFKDAASGDFSGIGNVAKAYASNPGVIAGSVAESAPAIVLGGAIGKGVGVVSKMSPIASTWIGEGAVAGGQQMASLTEEGVDARTASNASLATSVGVGALGAGGGKIAKRFGLADVDTALAGGAFRGVAKETADATLKGSVKEAAKRIAGGAVSEGVFEELPQSALEQTLSNLAQGKPWDDGIARASVEGTLAGSLMGGAFNAIPGRKPESAPSTDPVVDNKPAIAGLLPSPTYTGTPSEQTLLAEVERQNAVDAAQKSADQLYAERAAYQEELAKLYPSGLPTLTTDPDPLQQRIDAMLGIDMANLKGLRKVQYEKQFEAAMKEVVGITHDENGREIPLTMGALLDSKAMAEDSAKRRVASENASARSQQLADEESQQQPDIPVVGTLSRIANLGIQSGAIQRQGVSAMTQQVAPTVAKVQASPVLAETHQIDLRQRTDGQLSYLANNGKPGFREAAIAEIQRRGQTNAAKAQPLAQEAPQANDAQAGFEQTAAPKAEGVAQPPLSIPPEIVSRVAKRTDKELAFMGKVNRDPVVREAIALEMAMRAADSVLSNEQQAAAGIPDATARESRPAPAADQNRIKKAGPQNRDDLVGAILRVTGSKGIHPKMAQTIVGDTANKATKLRGLFTLGGQQDLDDLADLLRVEEGYDVRDGNHLSELIREQTAGNPVYSMERTERDAAENEAKKYREEIRSRAAGLGIKTVARKFDDIERDVLEAETKQAQDEAAAEREAIQAEEAVAEIDDDQLNVLLELAAREANGVEIDEQWITNEQILDAFEPIGEEDQDEQGAARAGETVAGEAGGNRQGRSNEAGFGLTGQTNAQAAEQFAQQQAGEIAEPTKEQADRERDAVPFSMQMQSQPKPQGRQVGLFTADGRVSAEANPADLPKNTQKLDTSPEPVQKSAKNEQVDPAEDGKPANKADAIGATVDGHSAFLDRLFDGGLTIDEFKAHFESVKNSKVVLVEELGKKTKPELLKLIGGYGADRYKNDKKDQVVGVAYRSMLDDFVLGDSISYSMGAKYEDVIGGYVGRYTQEDLQAYADKIKARREERQAQREDVAKAIDDPKTAGDFDTLLRAKKAEGMTFSEARMSLTPEQRAEYDRLKGIESRDQRKARADQQKTDVRVASQTTGAQIVEGTHSKQGYPLWSVQLADRVDGDSYKTLLSTAKRMGGNYVNQMQARMWKTVWGFQFKDQASAEAFMKLAAGDKTDAEATIQERRDAFADDRSQSAVERLNEMAERLEEKADESLGRERKENTERRARFAASAEAAANADKALAKTMRRIAEAISNGTAQFLDRVRQKAQIEYLTSVLRTAKDSELRTKYPSYADQEKHKGEPATGETADYAEFPQYAMMRSDLANLARKMVSLPNMKMLGQRILKVADDTSDAYTAFAKEHLLDVSRFGKADGSGWATFSTMKDAERSIEVSNLAAVAVPLQIKRGEYRIVLSPSEAISRGVWKGDDRKVFLSPEVGEEIVEKLGKLNRKYGKRRGMDAPPDAPWQFENTYNNRKRLSGMGIEQPWEFRAALREFANLKEAPKEADKIKAMERAMIGRKNDGLDFFPTPAETAQAMIDAAEITEGMSILEPSAGMGHIAERIRDAGVVLDVIEFNSDRRELLEAKGFNVVGNDFMEAGEQYDRIIMNPPFSNRRDAEHVQHAYSLLKPGGRIVAIMGEGVFFGQDKKAQSFREWLDEVGGTSEKLEDGTFLDPSLPVNTATNARMVVIDKPAGEVDANPETKETDSGVMLYNVADNPFTPDAYDAKAFADSVASIIETGSVPRNDLTIGDTPDVFKSLGAKSRSMVMPASVVKKATDPALRGHDVRVEDLKNLPSLLADPIMVFDSQTEIGALVAMVEAKDKSGNPIIVAIHVDTKGQGFHSVNKVASVYGKEGTAEVQRWINNSLRYYNKKKAPGWLRAVGLQLPEANTIKRLNKSVVTDGDIVKGNSASNGSISIADKAIYGMATEGKSAADILKFIASASRSPFNRQVAKLLLKTGINPTITVDDGKGWKMNAGDGHKYAAAYNPGTDTVALFRPASAERHALHELIHSATIKALSKKGLAAVQMRALFAHVQKNGKAAGLFYDQKTKRGIYGMADIDEFIAEAFSNPKFQALLKQVSAPKTPGSTLSSAWHWFSRIVRGILGLPMNMESALSRALDIGLGVMREDMKLRKTKPSVMFSEISGNEIDKVPGRNIQERARNWMKFSLQGKSFKNDATGWDISISRKGISKTMMHAAKEVHSRSVSAIPSLLKNAVLVASEQNRDEVERLSIPLVHHFYAPLRVGGKDFIARIVVKETNTGQKFYDYDTSDEISPAGSSDAYASLSKQGAVSDKARLDMSMSELLSYVKEEHGGTDPRFYRYNVGLKSFSGNGNVRGMADKDTVAGTQAPTSSGDGSKAGANVVSESTTDWAKVGKVYVGDNGRVTVYHMNGFSPGRSEKHSVANSVMDAFRPALPEGQYWRFTNNKNELKHIKSGELLRSKNHADNSDEIGLSVAEGAHYGIQGYKYGYIVSGDVVGRGSDGEPLLDVDNLSPVTKLMSVDEIVSKDRAERAELLKNRGWTSTQIADIANGTFKLEINPNEPSASAGSDAIRYNVADEGWSVSEPSKMDDVIYSLQDKHIDMKRVVQSIFKTGKNVRDEVNAYLQEELFHGRAAKGVKDFLDFELRPLLQEMMRNKIDMGDFEEYLWNAHAQERNEQIAKVNPEMNDGGSGIKTADAKAYLSGLSADRKQILESLADKIDAMNRNSQKVLVESGLEKQETIDAWNGAYKHYVPLQREDVDSGHVGTGKGFSIRGSSSKRAMGSGRNVVDIIANLTMQRERNIVRAEKNRVSNALMGLAVENPNDDFWTVDKAPTERVVEETAIYTVKDVSGKKMEEFTRMSEAEKFAKQHPGSEIEQSWRDRVKERIMPGFKSRDNVLLTRVNGEDHYVIFNERDERAMRMALAMKNLDADNLGRVLSVVGKATRYLASISTQFNPVFGVINLIRDTQGALLNLSSTPIAGDQKKVLGYTKDALIGIYKDIRAHRAGKKPSSDWAELFEEFQKEGGQTGYRDQYANAEARAESIKSELSQFKEGKAKQIARGLFGWLSDYNETMENAVRLAAYKAAKEKGMSNQQAASIAKNLTVNFNRKGQVATQVGALYAFFNASVQGSARLAQTLFEQSGGDAKTIRLSKTGKKILAGGIMLGSMQALLLAAAGFDDDEPPEFIRERNLILPIGDGKYLTLAMPLGFHVIPGIGRIATEFVLAGGKDPIKRMASLFSMFAESFNPVGNAGFSLQTIAPSVVDPFAALAENRDFTGKEIYRENFNALNPQPGHARAKDVATVWSRYISEALNFITGGTEFKPGLVSPSPDAIDYLIGQVAGGVGREANKVAQTAGATWSGEDLPLYKIPLVGRFVGDTEGQSGQSAKFYDALKQINMHESQMKGLRESQRFDEAREYAQENPAVRLIMAGNNVERTVRKLRAMKRDLIEKDAENDQIKAIDERITSTMRSFNERVGAVI